MISERAELIKTRCSELLKQKSMAGTIAILQEREERVHEIRVAIEGVAVAMTVLKERIDREHLSQIVDSARRYVKLQEYLRELEASHELLTAAESPKYKRIFDQLKAVCSEVQELTKQAWVSYATEREPSDHRDVLRAFERAHPEVVRRLAEIRERLEGLTAVSMPTPEQIGQFDGAVDEHNGLLDQLLGGDVPRAVVDALRLAGSSDGAPLRVFDPEVVDWLRKAGVEDAFRVRL